MSSTITDEKQRLVERLREADLDTERMIDVHDGAKKSTDHTQQKPSSVVGNYGVYAGDRLIIVDVDDGGDVPDLPETFKTKTPHSTDDADGHYYYKVPAGTKHKLDGRYDKMNPAPSWGEIRVHNQYVVGPGSELKDCDKDWCDTCAAEGGRYEVEDDREIHELSWYKLRNIVEAGEAETADASQTTDAVETDTAVETNAEMSGDYDYDERLELALEHDDKLETLYRGSHNAAGYDDRSTADCALAAKLAFWFEGDKHDVRRAMDDSNAEKWHERTDDSYRSSVLEAVDECTEYYEPHRDVEPQIPDDASPDVKPPDKDDNNESGNDKDTAADEAEPSPYSECVSRIQGYIDAYEDANNDTPSAGKINNNSSRIISSVADFVVTQEDDELWRYNPETDKWRDDGAERVRDILVDALGDEYSRRKKNEIIDQIKANVQTKSVLSMGVGRDKIPVQNGIIEVGDGLRDAEPYDFVTAKFQATYDPDAECPRWREFVENSTRSGSDLKKLQEYVGYILLTDQMPYHKTMFLVGPKHSGKSTFIKTVAKLVPGGAKTAEADRSDWRISGASPQQLMSRFGRAKLLRSWLNASADIPAESLEDTGTFKTLVGDDIAEADRKYKETVTFRPTTKHIFSANQLPPIPEADDAVWRRILIVPFPDSVPKDERDTSLEDKLADELDGILNWALEGLERLLEQDGFTADLTEDKTREKWDTWGTTVMRFRARVLRDDPGNEISVSEVYNTYKRWCAENDMMPRGKVSFGKELTKYPYIDTVQTGGGKHNERTYTNIKIREGGV